MLNLKAIDYGLEPNVTGFEDEIISKATKLDLKTIKKLRNE